MSEEERGFVIRDKRGRTEAEASSPSSAQPSNTSSKTESPSSTDSAHFSPPLSFSSFVFSLGTSSLMLMGESLDPQQPAPPMNLPQAKEIIDILSMLEEKTQKNLSPEETSVLGDMLYTLRMKYVSLTSGKGSTISS
jgi:hypothetical protein